MKVLIVEDQPRLGNFIKLGLAECNYTTVWAHSCQEARDALAETTFDAIVLDLGLPDGDGLELLRQWREIGFNEPVLVLSARDSVDDRVKGLDLGADDYLAKPFSMEELRARVRSLVRRHFCVKRTVLEYEGLHLDLLNHSVTLDGKPVKLTSREYALLEIFMHNRGRILTRTLIAEKIWNSHHDVDTNVIDVYMSRLRNKLEGTSGKIFFETVRGVGYQFA
ncbi:response regulator transcription factor [Cupriavidus basilensis]|uniref:Response regulator transcription factor n=1 Tax=Cupriavidus basilensis TaxID=68895 RepID=A0ABT6B4T9_9BURK|nr:response regulator transcription factor [Cupriavidus basilensis]MDF3839739.1 response regulator transcription factor [Cupriavidus basilensis]